LYEVRAAFEEGSRERGMIEASCHCGAVRLEIDSPPDEATDCHCSICRRYGALWAYYEPGRVRVLPAEPPTDVYVWGDRTLTTHRCRNCGCVSHWVAMDPEFDVMGVNARLMGPGVLAAARVRYSPGP
jgi:hypothetical protein